MPQVIETIKFHFDVKLRLLSSMEASRSRRLMEDINIASYAMNFQYEYSQGTFPLCDTCINVLQG